VEKNNPIPIKMMFETIHLSLINFLLLTVLEGDFLNGYLASFGNVGFLRGARGLLNGFANDLRNQLEFVPGGRSSSEEEESSMSRTGNVNATDGSGFNPVQFITDIMNAIENLAATDLAGGLTNEGAQCIRQVIQVLSYKHVHKTLILLSRQ
jgi:hypothetical protein